MAKTNKTSLWGSERISRLLLRLAPPVMLAQLIQALYNIVDSLFVGKYSQSGLTALSIIYPIQLLMIAFGVGINTVVSGKLGVGDKKAADQCSGLSLPLEFLLWVIFAVGCYFMMPWFAGISTSSKEVIDDVVSYGRIVCAFSFGLFLESGWTKAIQANGDVKTPMIAQIIGLLFYRSFPKQNDEAKILGAADN